MHGRVFHALAVMARWQLETGARFDCIIEVGDLGAFPDTSRLDEATVRFAQEDLTELDFIRLVMAQGKLAKQVRLIRRQFNRPVYFIRGNHEDQDWLAELAAGTRRRTVPVDPFDLLLTTCATVVSPDLETLKSASWAVCSTRLHRIPS